MSHRSLSAAILSLRVLVAAAAVPALSGCGSLIVTQQSVGALEGRRGFTWETHEIEGFALYVEPGSTASREVREIEADARRARQRVLDYLQEPAYEPTVSIFVVGSRDRMKDLVGRRTNATGYSRSNAVCLIRSDTVRVGATHELLHIVAMNLWGVPERWMNEGMAVDAAGPWRGRDPHAVCRDLRSREELPSLREITHHFGRLPPTTSYPAAGSFVRFLRETYGLAVVREVWDGGRGILAEATNTDPDSLQAAWLSVVEHAAVDGLD